MVKEVLGGPLVSLFHVLSKDVAGAAVKGLDVDYSLKCRCSLFVDLTTFPLITLVDFLVPTIYVNVHKKRRIFDTIA